MKSQDYAKIKTYYHGALSFELCLPLLILHAQQRRHAGKNLQGMRQNFT